MLKQTLKYLHVLFRQKMLRLRLVFVGELKLTDDADMLVIAPHPDDEIFGLGGLMVRRLSAGGKVSVIYLTDGEMSLPALDPELVAQKRIEICEGVMRRLGVEGKNIFFLHLADGKLPKAGENGFEDAVEKVSALLDTQKPRAVFVTHPMDTWPYDHIAACEIAVAAMNKKNLHDVIPLYAYWVWLWYSLPAKKYGAVNWENTWRIPVREVMKEKRLLMDCYLKPLAPNGKPWSGVLPRALLKAFDYQYEVVTKLLK